MNPARRLKAESWLGYKKRLDISHLECIWFICLSSNILYIFCVEYFVQESSDLQNHRVCDKFQKVFSILEEKQQVSVSVGGSVHQVSVLHTAVGIWVNLQSLFNIHKGEAPLYTCTITVIESQVMTQRLRSEQEEKTSRIQALIRCYENNVEANRKLLEQASHSIKEGDLVTFIQVCRCGVISEDLANNVAQMWLRAYSRVKSQFTCSRLKSCVNNQMCRRLVAFVMTLCDWLSVRQCSSRFFVVVCSLRKQNSFILFPLVVLPAEFKRAHYKVSTIIKVNVFT